MSFFSHNNRFSVRAQEIKFWKYYGKPKNKFSNFHFIFEVQNVRIDGSIPNMVLELSLKIFYPYLGRKHAQISLKSDSWPIFTFFFAKLWVNCYWSSILRPYLESSHQDESFRPPIWKKIWKFIFLLPMVFLEFHLLCENRKSIFMGYKWYSFVIQILWHGISYETWKKLSLVKNETT